jgi:hypothetical protein
MGQYDYLEELTPEIYKHQLNPAQQFSVILDIANQIGFTYNNNANIRAELNVQEPVEENPRLPYVVIYNNAARPTCNNGHLMLNKHIKDTWGEAIEFECGYKRPSDDWYARHDRDSVRTTHIQPIEVHQESINTDYSDLNAVKKLLQLWYKIMNYDWNGQLVDATIKG